MSNWFATATEGGGVIVTANRRLARDLRARYGELQLAKGASAWLTPTILEYRQWLHQLATTSTAEFPVLLSASQSQVLWERALHDELGASASNLNRLGRDARSTRERLADFAVPVAQTGDYAFSEDQRLFAAALNRYLQMLAKGGWTDHAGLLAEITERLSEGEIAVPPKVCFAGFVLDTPQLRSLKTALGTRNCAVSEPPTPKLPTFQVARVLNDDQELLAAGQWARRLVDKEPDAAIGIVVSGLQERAEAVRRQIREGFCPGWQLHTEASERLVNVSYGQRLIDYPAIQAAMLGLRWMLGDLAGEDVSIVLRSASFAQRGDASRTQCELALRESPDRDWSIQDFTGMYGGQNDQLSILLDGLADGAELIPKSPSSPGVFARQFDLALQSAGWPGVAGLSSDEYQLVNRWRELLNEFAALHTVSAKISPSVALSRLRSMLAEAVFQPENPGDGIRVLGPLEAVGLQFDALWIVGMQGENWPGNRRPNPLLSLDLQREHGMPDAHPKTALEAAQGLFDAVCATSADIVLGFAQFDGDAERSASPMIPDTAADIHLPAPTLFAASLINHDCVQIAPADPVPPVGPDDRVFGGASAIDRQATSPFDAFALSRLAIRTIWPFNAAFSAKDRGILVHAALAEFYTAGLTASDIRRWSEATAEDLAKDACFKSFQGAFRGKTRVQAQILRFEEARMRRLLLDVWKFDSKRRGDFEIAAIEQRQNLTIESLRLNLQADRIDRLDDASLLVLDYKTGDEKRLLSKGQLTSFQLVLYAMAAKGETTGIGLFNVNAGGIRLHGAGQSISAKEDLFADNIAEWKAIALAHAKNLVSGDVRVLAQQSGKDSRRTGLLSRVQELKREL